LANRYRFDDVQIDGKSFRLLKAGKVVPIEPKALNLLIFLVENRGRLVEKRELIDAVWGDAFVTEHVLNYSIGQFRKGLADDAKNPKYIETFPTLGHRFIADPEVERLEGVGKAPVLPKAHSEPQKATPDLPLAESSQPVAGELASVPEGHLRRYAVVVLAVTQLAVVSGAVFWFERRGGDTSGGVPIRSLAVIPLVNLSGDISKNLEESTRRLEKAYELCAGVDEMTFLAIDPSFDPLRFEPRFGAFLHHVGLPPQPHYTAALLSRPSH
jgi:DNA-binding winged helix-turn-helix (wHTH) protein